MCEGLGATSGPESTVPAPTQPKLLHPRSPRGRRGPRSGRYDPRSPLAEEVLIRRAPDATKRGFPDLLLRLPLAAALFETSRERPGEWWAVGSQPDWLPAVRLELALGDGTALWVELSQRRQAALALREGSAVGVFPRAWRAYRAGAGDPVR